MKTKVCTKCGRKLPATREYFFRYSRQNTKLRPSCIECCNIQKRAYKTNNPNKIRKQCKAYYENNKGKIQERQKVWNERNKERMANYSKAWYENNKERLRKVRKAWYERNKENLKEKREAYRETHKEVAKEYGKKYRENNKGKRRRWKHHRRAREKEATIHPFSEESWLRIQPKPYRCYLCGKQIKGAFHIDHKIPLSRGGDHAPWNLALTHPKCNLSKKDKLPNEYAPKKFAPSLF